MSETQDRPAALPRRAPRPAPDQNVDPVDIPAEKPEPKTAESVIQIPRKKREPLFPFSTRLSESALNLIEAAAVQEGIPQRAAVEQAILHYWGRRIKA